MSTSEAPATLRVREEVGRLALSVKPVSPRCEQANSIPSGIEVVDARLGIDQYQLQRIGIQPLWRARRA